MQSRSRGARTVGVDFEAPRRPPHKPAFGSEANHAVGGGAELLRAVKARR